MTSLKIFPLFVLWLANAALAQQNWQIFTSENSPLPSGFVSDIFIDDQNLYWISVRQTSSSNQAGGGLARFDGSAWQVFDKTNSTIPSQAIVATVVDHSGKIWAVCSDLPIIHWDGTQWREFSSPPVPDSSFFNLVLENDSTLWFINWADGITRYENGTWHWMLYQSDPLVDFVKVWPIVKGNFAFIDSKGQRWFGSDYYGLARFNGTTWKWFFKGDTLKPFWATVAGVAEDKDGVLWAITGGITAGRLQTPLFSVRDTSLSFYSLTINDEPIIPTYDGIAVDRHNTKWITTRNGLLKFDGAISAMYDSSNSPIHYASNIVIDQWDNKVFSAQLKGGGNALAFFNETGVKGISTSVSANESTPELFLLEQNYPNPFNHGTTIRFALPKRLSVTLKLFDLQGKEVMTLVDQELSSGEHSVSVDTESLPTGVYFYRLQANNPSPSAGQRFVRTKKLILLK